MAKSKQQGSNGMATEDEMIEVSGAREHNLKTKTFLSVAPIVIIQVFAKSNRN